ncbi:Ribosome biogenesis protein erb1, partial [Bienertia sinuspersici]
KDGKLVRYATCIHCYVAKYKADPKYGTSIAKKHLDLCDAYQAYLAANPLPTPEFDKKRSCSCDNVNSSFFKGSGLAVADQWVFVSAQCLPVKLTFYWIYATLVAVTIDGLIL